MGFMIHHLSLGVRDLAVSGQFYDAVLATLGYRRVFEDDTAIGYGLQTDEDILCLKLNADAVPFGPGCHLAFGADTREAVACFHAAALRFGGGCNGEPGLRADYGDHYCAAFVVDPDGYRLEAVCKAEATTPAGAVR
jgi:catechol 2,3-dioxygenase-like lactoylglutathione lyase family enzyme